MRKLWITTSILVVLSMLLAACGQATQTPTATPEPTVAPTAASTGGETTATAAPVVGALPGECQLSQSIFPEPKGEEWQKYAPISPTDHSIGPDDATLTILEYADFTCPYCQMVAPVFEQLLADYPDDVRYVYRNFPVGHTNSNIAIQAAIAADKQGKYWEMHNALFAADTWETWNQMTTDDFKVWAIAKATELGMDAAQFETDMNSEETVATVTQMQSDAIAAGLSATPSIFVFVGGNLLWAINVDQNDQLNPSYYVFSAIIKLWNLRERQFTECPPMTIDTSKEYYATLETSKGNIVIQLLPDVAPLSVNSFVFLANQGWFDGVPFHRVLDGFVAQTGDPSGTGIGDPGYQFGDEISDLTFDSAGVVGMANSGSGTNGSQFFITLDAVPDLNGRYTIFGKVVEGLDVLPNIIRVDPTAADQPTELDTIIKVTIEVR